MENCHEILNFWFDGVDDDTLIDRTKPPFSKWFAEDKEFDEEIKRRFEDEINCSFQDHYPECEKTTRGKLALIILFDQMNRNVHRGTPKMYRCDCYSRRLAMNIIEENKDRELMLIERVFLYMPLMHTEVIDYQEFSVRNFSALYVEAAKRYPHNQYYYSYHLRFAHEAYDMIKKHGRFLHRDEILGRSDSSEMPFDSCS